MQLFAGEILPKTIKHKLQVKQNRIIKTLRSKFGTKTRLKPLYEQLQFTNTNNT